MDNAVSFKEVSYSYGEHTVLEKIDITIKKGEFVALLGHNGAGKTTLMKLALGLLPIQKGKIQVLGTPVGQFMEWQKVGYIQQTLEEFDFKFPATVMEVILMGRLSKKRGLLKLFDKSDHAAVENALRVIGIEGLKDKRLGTLSGGQRQKVFLAKTIASDAEILFLDEPTAAMDYNSQHAFYDLLQKLNEERNMTIVLITHDIGQIFQHVKRVIILNRTTQFDGDAKKLDRKKMWEITERV